MTYIDYLNRFNSWCESNTLAASSQLLYYKLLYLFNRAGWPKQVLVDTRRLMYMVQTTSNKTAYRARDALVTAGFITYKSGRKGSPSVYFLCTECTAYDTVCDTENDTVCDTENDTHNKTKIKTKKENISLSGDKKESPHRARFSPPTVEEVSAYCQERSNGIDPEQFVNYYASKGWVVGKSPMKDWKASVRTWEGKRKQEAAQSGGYQKKDYGGDGNWSL